jgi:hypothetical protein
VTWKAIRQGNMKYIWMKNDRKTEDYLFDLDIDLPEKKNLVDTMPDEVRRLKILLNSWEDEVKPVR